MTPNALFITLVGAIVFNFLLNTFVNNLNVRQFKNVIPNQLKDVYNSIEYQKSLDYKRAVHRFSFWSSLIRILFLLLFLFIGGFAWLNNIVSAFSNTPVVVSYLFIIIIMLTSFLTSIPFSYYNTFVLEENFGFNRTTRNTFLLDKFKQLFTMLFLGSAFLILILWLYTKTDSHLWIYIWGLMILFSIFMSFFYSTLIVPFFNKQKPLANSNLKNVIQNFSKKAGFEIENIYVINGSKRSSKANAYFSGFGPKKRIVLYDTLLDYLDTDEIVGVLAHEIGHYKKKHTIYNMLFSSISTGITLYILMFFIDSPIVVQSLGINTPSFHIGVIVFGLLYSPISKIITILNNMLSRKFEYQADAYAKINYNGESLISALKKLSKTSLSNLTPHPAYVFINYSHPTLLQRINKLEG